MILLSIKLVFAHLLGDFVLQPTAWIKHKEMHRHRSRFLHYHIVIHGLILIVVLQFENSYWLGWLIITFTHWIIDYLKTRYKDALDSKVLFFTDQLAHLLVIAFVVYIYEPYTISFEALYTPRVFLILTALIMLTGVSSVLMKVIINRWDLNEDNEEDSLPNAGKYIGMLERLFIFGFIAINYWQGIGFLLAAKSVFRFGDMSRSKDRKLTEYILIGTLLSFGMAMLIGLGYENLIKTL
ncbi:MAG: DUF3307 domain-containing protein [Cyclobacteriaceae bacterium]|nr:DUF3307 domain-containing protein [Cyclobacteriaceae bacterium]